MSLFYSLWYTHGRSVFRPGDCLSLELQVITHNINEMLFALFIVDSDSASLDLPLGADPSVHFPSSVRQEVYDDHTIFPGCSCERLGRERSWLHNILRRISRSGSIGFKFRRGLRARNLGFRFRRRSCRGQESGWRTGLDRLFGSERRHLPERNTDSDEKQAYQCTHNGF